MTRNRQTLKSYFADGCMPAGWQFAELIDATVNMQDEGFQKTPEDGLKIASAVGRHRLLTFYRSEGSGQGLWALDFGGVGDPLALLPLQPERRRGAGPAAASGRTAPAISLHRDGRVGVGTVTPRHLLEVAGTLAAPARLGTQPLADAAKMKADGGWHTVLKGLRGRVAFEVVASTGAKGSGRHAVLHAFALNACNPEFGGLLGWLARRLPGLGIERRFNRRKRIRAHSAWFAQRCDQLELQWAADNDEGSYQLQIRTRCAYPDAPPIEVHATALLPTDPAAQAQGADTAAAAPDRRAVAPSAQPPAATEPAR